jgi:SAM-dependent methyltransferase
MITQWEQRQVSVDFSAHNIRLDNGICTKPDLGFTMDSHTGLVSARRVLDCVFPGEKACLRLADLGCLEGGYAVEFARMGFQVLGLEVRPTNFEACRYVKANTHLPNLDFVLDDAWNLPQYGQFDAIFCCGLLYHLDRPREFLNILAHVTKRSLIVQTHFSTEVPVGKFNLSDISENEGLRGRWYTEYGSDGEFLDRENRKFSSWGNHRSFWLTRESLLQAIQDVGFDLVLEQFDSLGDKIADSMTTGYYRNEARGTFVGVKTARQC